MIKIKHEKQWQLHDLLDYQVADARQEAMDEYTRYTAELEEKDAWMNRKLAREIDRTNLAEQQMQIVKEKFCKKVEKFDREGRMAKLRHDEFVLATRSEAMESISKAETGVPIWDSFKGSALSMRICITELCTVSSHWFSAELIHMRKRMREELMLEADMNEEELHRISSRAEGQFNEQEDKNKALWADCQTAHMALSKKSRDLLALESINENQVQVKKHYFETLNCQSQAALCGIFEGCRFHLGVYSLKKLYSILQPYFASSKACEYVTMSTCWIPRLC